MSTDGAAAAAAMPVVSEDVTVPAILAKQEHILLVNAQQVSGYMAQCPRSISAALIRSIAKYLAKIVSSSSFLKYRELRNVLWHHAANCNRFYSKQYSMRIYRVALHNAIQMIHTFDNSVQYARKTVLQALCIIMYHQVFSDKFTFELLYQWLMQYEASILTNAIKLHLDSVPIIAISSYIELILQNAALPLQ
jgi:hypothetical protein